MVLLRNLSATLVNGRRGVVIGFDQNRRPEVRFDNGEGLALDVAKVSDDCEHVLDTLNHKRGAIMATTDLQDVEKIQLLETFFDRLNHQHGMGFVLHTPMGYAP